MKLKYTFRVVTAVDVEVDVPDDANLLDVTKQARADILARMREKLPDLRANDIETKSIVAVLPEQ